MVYAMGMNSDAMSTLLSYISRLPPGKPAVLLGYTPTYKDGSLHPSEMNERQPKVLMALQFLVRNHFRIADVICVRLAHSVSQTRHFPHAKGSTLIHYTDDTSPRFKYYESGDTCLDIRDITKCNNARIIQCIWSDDSG